MKNFILIATVVLFTTVDAAGAGIHKLLKPMQHMQRVMGMRVAKRPPAYKWFSQVWYGYNNPPHKNQWLCIHRFEGSWKDDGAPFWGGLQMDWSFQTTYGYYLYRLKGTANHWNPIEQMWTAEKAFRAGRGFYPWPNTARYCGLI